MCIIFVYLHETGKFEKSGQKHFKLHTEKETKKTQDALKTVSEQQYVAKP